jgi:hypothetical protein
MTVAAFLKDRLQSLVRMTQKRKQVRATGPHVSFTFGACIWESSYSQDLEQFT